MNAYIILCLNTATNGVSVVYPKNPLFTDRNEADRIVKTLNNPAYPYEYSVHGICIDVMSASKLGEVKK